MGAERALVAAADADGRATLDADPADEGRLEVFAEGHVLQAVDPLSPPPSHDDPLLVVLEPGIPLPGRVVAAEDGRPIVGARVRMNWLRSEGDVAEATSGADGRFTLRVLGIPDDPAFFDVSALDRPFAFGLHSAAPPTSPIELRVDAGRIFDGVVRDRSGAPVPDARVRAVSPWTRRQPPESASLAHVTTDAAGRFRLRVPKPADAAFWWLVASARDGDFGLVELNSRFGSARTIQLVGFGALAGRVVAPDGSPIAGARVRAAYVADLHDWIRAEGRDASVSRDAGRSAPTSSDGSFRIDHILSLPVDLRIEFGGRLATVDARAHAIPGEVTVLEPVVLRETASSERVPVLRSGPPQVPLLLTVTREGRPYDGPLRVATRLDPLLARAVRDGPPLVVDVRWVSCVAGRATAPVPSALARYAVELRSAEAEPAFASGVAEPEPSDPTTVRGVFDLRVR